MPRWPLVLAISGMVACHRDDAPAPAAATPRDTRPVGPGMTAPSFTSATIAGARASVPDGRVTVLVFWATWSHPDMKELVALQQIESRLAARGLAIVAVSIDDTPDHLTEFASTYSLHYPIVWDEGHRVALRYQPAADPSTYVIDAHGVVRKFHPGFHEDDARAIEAEVTELLAARR